MRNGQDPEDEERNEYDQESTVVYGGSKNSKFRTEFKKQKIFQKELREWPFLEEWRVREDHERPGR